MAHLKFIKSNNLEKDSAQSKGDESDAEVEAVFNEMTRSSVRYVDKDPFLVKDVVSTFRWPDITVGYHDSRPISSVLFHNVRPVVITGGASGKVQLFRVGDRSEAGNFLQNVRFTNFPITCMGLLQGGCSVVCGSIRQEYLMKYDLEQGAVMQLRLPKCVPSQNIGRFAVSKDGSLLAMIARNAQVYVLSSSSMELVKTLSSPSDVASVQFLPGSNHEIWAMTGNSAHFRTMCEFILVETKIFRMHKLKSYVVPILEYLTI
ncbi:hypothetical protein OSTOST_24910 [Ostertagia ostertagi]